MNNDNDSIQFPDIVPELELSFLNELKNKEHMIEDINFPLDFDPSILIPNGKDAKTETTTKILPLNKMDKKKFNLKISFKPKPNEKTKKKEKIKFNVTIPIKINFEENINKIIQRMNLNEEEKKGILLDENKNSEEINTIRAKLLNDKIRLRNRDKEKNNIEEKITDIKINVKRGRKKKDDNTKRKNNKYRTYNIIRKIKNKIMHYLLLFINNLIKSLYTKEQINEILFELHLPQIKSYETSIQVIKKIEHDIYAKQMKTEENINFLNSKIKKYLSNNISKKFVGIPLNSNEIIISRLLQDENKKNIFKFIFEELSIDDWLNIFTYQIDFEHYEKSKNLLNEEQISMLSNNLIGIDSLMLEFINDKDFNKNYFHCFMILIYNLKEYISKKEIRKNNSGEEKMKKDI